MLLLLLPWWLFPCSVACRQTPLAAAAAAAAADLLCINSYAVLHQISRTVAAAPAAAPAATLAATPAAATLHLS